MSADLAFRGATWVRRGATRAILVGFGCSAVAVAVTASLSSVFEVVILRSPCAMITAITIWITLVRQESKRTLYDFGATSTRSLNQQLAGPRLKFRVVKLKRECSVAILPIPTRLNFQMALIPGISSQRLQVHIWIGSLLWRYLRPGPDKLSPDQVVPGTIDGIDGG